MKKVLVKKSTRSLFLNKFACYKKLKFDEEY
ncbi:GSCOCG00003581001-RA-CDS [Cotesia congregata]|nr:GSCOCG00003581001-RA-CDS [Cotesia congregata]